MPGDAAVKSVFSQALLTAEQAELVGSNDQVQVAGFLADGTITLMHRDRFGNPDFQFHPTTVTTACTGLHKKSSKALLPAG